MSSSECKLIKWLRGHFNLTYVGLPFEQPLHTSENLHLYVILKYLQGHRQLALTALRTRKRGRGMLRSG